jgi:predicted secreted hydrolase
MLYFPAKPWAGYYAAEYAITDISSGTFHYGREPVIVGQPQPIADGFQLHAEHAQATGRNGDHHLKVDLDGYQLDLHLQPTKPPVLQWPNGDGYLNAYCQTDYFYSRERMKLSGTLTRGRKTVSVTGTSNFDHQWGFDPALDFAPWNYWTFQLKDGRDIFISDVQLRRGGDEATVRSGSVSDRNGNVTILHRADFTVTPTRFWHRDTTCSWPVEWNVDVKGLHLQVRAAVDSAEVRPTSSPATLALWPGWADYWDGPTTVTGDATGQGFVDQGHYCAA